VRADDNLENIMAATLSQSRRRGCDASLWLRWLRLDIGDGGRTNTLHSDDRETSRTGKDEDRQVLRRR
jgi:hypothetical protein